MQKSRKTIISSQQCWLGPLTTTRGGRSTYVSFFSKSLAMWVIWREFWHRFWRPTHSHCENSRYRGNRRSTMRARWERQTNRDAPWRKAKALRADLCWGSVCLLMRPCCQVPTWSVSRQSAELSSKPQAFQAGMKLARVGSTRNIPQVTNRKTGSKRDSLLAMMVDFFFNTIKQFKSIS